MRLVDSQIVLKLPLVSEPSSRHFWAVDTLEAPAPPSRFQPVTVRVSGSFWTLAAPAAQRSHAQVAPMKLSNCW